MDVSYLLQTTGKLLPFLWVTLSMVLASMALGLFFGFWLTVMKLSGKKPLVKIAYGYTTVIRSTPTVILIYIVFYGLPMLLNVFGIDTSAWDKRVFTIIALTLYASSVLSEIMRPAYQAVDRGQYEAAVSVGLTFPQALRLILLPQAVVTALPNFGNMFIALIHESALAYLIGTIDLMGQANIISAVTYGANQLEIYLAVSLIFWAVSVLAGKLVDALTAYLRRSARTFAREV